MPSTLYVPTQPPKFIYPSIPPHVWEDWVVAIPSPQVRLYRTTSSLSPVWTLSPICGVCYYWTPPFQFPKRNDINCSQTPTSVRRVKKWFGKTCKLAKSIHI
ncbi:MAG: hypothetical protein ACTS53_02100 [Candidatus Hodgkinia cicadicola]